MAFPGKTSKYAPGVSTAKGKAEARRRVVLRSVLSGWKI